MVKKAKSKIEGFVVKKGDQNRFLSRSKKFVRHSNHKNPPGVNRAWVHTEESILKGGKWTNRFVMLLPASFDPVNNSVKITGQPVLYNTFIKKHKQIKLDKK